MKVLFVCLGNICRSPMAEAIMRHRLAAVGLSDKVSVDSAATGGYNTGSEPHMGTKEKLDCHNISYDGIYARKITEEDIINSDYIITMDYKVLNRTKAMCLPEHEQKVVLLSSFTDQTQWEEVPDPWYTGDFDLAYRLICEGCAGVMKHIQSYYSEV